MYKTILHATDLSEDHFQISQKAKELADFFNAKLYLFHVIELPASIQLAQSLGFTELASPAKDDAMTVLQVLGDSLNVPTTQQMVEIGTASEHILSKAKQLACDLIIIGSHTSVSLSPFLGSTANAITHHADCDVLTLRNE